MFGHTLNGEPGVAPVSLVGDRGRSRPIGQLAGPLQHVRERPRTSPTSPATASSEWKGNLGGGNGCIAAFTYSYNVGETCSGTGEVPVSPAVNTSSFPNQAPFYVDAPG